MFQRLRFWSSSEAKSTPNGKKKKTEESAELAGEESETSEECRVDFQVSSDCLGHGQDLYLIGDVAPLGDSLELIPRLLVKQQFCPTSPTSSSSSSAAKPNASTTTSTTSTTGVALVTTPDLYPIYYNSEPVLLPKHTTIHYRYVVFSGGKFLRFETSAIRELHLNNTQEVTVQDTLDQSSACSVLSASSSSSSSREKIASSADSSSSDSTALLGSSPPLSTVVPRLSSGQAFVDPRAAQQLSTTTSKRTSKSISQLGVLAEEEEVPMEIESDSKAKKPVLNAASMHLSKDKGNSPSLYSPLSTNIMMKRRRSVSDELLHNSMSEVTIQPTDGVIVVVYRLPVLLNENPAYENGQPISEKYIIEWENDNLLCPSGLVKNMTNEDLLAGFGKNSNTNMQRLTWVGTLCTTLEIPKEEEEWLTTYLLEVFHCVPVFIESKVAKMFHKYCYGTLWPIFHNLVDVYGKLPTRWWNPSHQKSAWSSYTQVNRMFVNKVIENFNVGDYVWVHGLHLLCAPSFLSRRLPNVNVGFFLHTPFPSSEIFRTLSVRDDILRGMLSADHIGFHLYEYARHFLTSCRRILGLKYGPQPGGYIGVEYNGRIVAVTISHIGIEPPLLSHLYEQSKGKDMLACIEQTYLNTGDENSEKVSLAGRKLIVGIDRIERLKGVELKLLAFESFLLSSLPDVNLASYSHMLQIGIVDPSTEPNPADNVLRIRAQIEALVARINAKAGQRLVTYVEVSKTTLAKRLPLWVAADLLLLTSIRDAVNLYPFEFRYAQHLANRNGVIISSEFTGSSRVLNGSVGINPWKKVEIVEALRVSLHMSFEEQQARHEKDLEYVISNTRTNWAERVLIDLKKSCSRKTPDGETTSKQMGYGLGLGYRMVEYNTNFNHLDTDLVVRHYRSSIRRVLLFDYGNTLSLEMNKSMRHRNNNITTSSSSSSNSNEELYRSCNERVLSLLKNLCADSKNTVFVLSGKDQHELENLVGSIGHLGLAAEHGFYYKWPNSGGNEAWLCTQENFDESWKDVTHSVMDIYTQRTHGTYVERKGSALLWQYAEADPEFGSLQAKELHDQLTQVLAYFNVEVLTGSAYIEVRPSNINKGVMVDRIMSCSKTTKNNHNIEIDFVLCIGDDDTDEFMFRYLRENHKSRIQKLYTVTVGRKPSDAQYFLDDIEQVHELLMPLGKASTIANRNLSLNNLHDYEHKKASPMFWTSVVDEITPSDAHNAFQHKNHISSSSELKHQFSLDCSTTSSSPAPTSGFPRPFFSTTGTQEEIGGLKKAKYSMSMSALSSMQQRVVPATFEQYTNNYEEEDEGGIFF